jgi:hypothetical protein
MSRRQLDGTHARLLPAATWHRGLNGQPGLGLGFRSLTAADGTDDSIAVANATSLPKAPPPCQLQQTLISEDVAGLYAQANEPRGSRAKPTKADLTAPATEGRPTRYAGLRVSRPGP